MGRKINFIWKASDANVPSIYKRTIYVFFFVSAECKLCTFLDTKESQYSFAQDFFSQVIQSLPMKFPSKPHQQESLPPLRTFFLLQWGLFLVWSWIRASGNGGSAGKESAYNAGDLGLIPGLRRSPGEGKGYLLQYSGLENSMDHIVHGVTKSRTWLTDFYFQRFLTLCLTAKLTVPLFRILFTCR